MIKQQPLTIVAPVTAGQENALKAKLQELRPTLEKELSSPFEIINTIHYARILLLQPGSNANPANTSLVFSTDYDGTQEEHVTAIATKMDGLIDQLFCFCSGYPAPEKRNSASRKEYLLKFNVKEDSFYIGAPGRSLQQIKQESTLRNYIWKELKETNWQDKSATEVHKALQHKILSEQGFDWVKEKVTIPKVKWGYFVLMGLLLSGIGFFNYWILIGLAVFVGGWLVMLHFFYEIKDKPLGLTPSRIDENHIKELEQYEDIHNQNQFSQLIPMKPGRVRMITLQALMLYARFRVNVEFVKGKLMGIPTIHFARWLRVEGNKQMLFFSNFDGSWQQYLGDFIDKSGWGLTAIFGNTQNFPPARYLFWGGAYDEEHFLAWSRYYQIPTQVWYCAYPHLSIKNINNNTYIRHEIIKTLTEKQAQLFLQRF